MAQTFEAQVSSWVRKSDRLMTDVFKMSSQDAISEMQEVGPSVANPDSSGTGRMPVDRGFLRASLQAALNSLPVHSMVFRPPTGNAVYDPSPVALVIASAKGGDTIFATYGMEYAPAMEEKYAFVRLTAQNWQAIVNRNVRRLARLPGAQAFR